MTTRMGLALVGAMLCLISACGRGSPAGSSSPEEGKTATRREVALPPPVIKGTMPLEEALHRRRSVRSFQPKDLTSAQLGQLAWAAQGITAPRGLRTAPSAGALYPITIYLVTRQGLFEYLPVGHKLRQLAADDRRADLSEEALGQPFLATAALDLIIAGDAAKLEGKYGDRSERYLFLEAGHVAQNVLLQAVALGLGAVPVGAYDDAGVAKVVGLPSQQQPLYLLPVGYPEG